MAITIATIIAHLIFIIEFYFVEYSFGLLHLAVGSSIGILSYFILKRIITEEDK